MAERGRRKSDYMEEDRSGVPRTRVDISLRYLFKKLRENNYLYNETKHSKQKQLLVIKMKKRTL